MKSSNQQDQSKSSEMSMDEVLASIRKIIATDNESSEDNKSQSYESSEIIELTDEIKECHGDGSLNPNSSVDYIENIDEDLLTREAVKSSKESISTLSKILTSTTEKVSESKQNITIEDLVMQALKPMLKEWMSNNLPIIIEKIVRQEIQKLTQK